MTFDAEIVRAAYPALRDGYALHATPHTPVDVGVLGADFYATSAYKWSGPHIGMVIADPDLLETSGRTSSPPRRTPCPNVLSWGRPRTRA